MSKRKNVPKSAVEHAMDAINEYADLGYHTLRYIETALETKLKPSEVTYRLYYRVGDTNCCVVERSTGSEEHTGKSLERLFIEDVKYWMETEPRDTYNIEIKEGRSDD